MWKALLITIVAIFLFSAPVLAQEDAPAAPAQESRGTFFEKLSFGEDTFLGKLDGQVLKFAATIESWRAAKETKFGESIDTVSAKRNTDKKDAKPATKVMSFLHLVLLSVLLFVFSLNTVFYLAVILITFGVVRRVLGFLFGLVRHRVD